MSSTYLPLQVWNHHWQLDGQRLSCRRCSGLQHVADVAPFRHTQDCKARRFYAQYPFRDLGAIVEQKIQDGLF
nr:hypothetical protein pA4J1_11 [Pseudomonas sp.]QDK64848.1 hypothetical protein pA22BJ2_p09 [Pseudomonas sp.]